MQPAAAEQVEVVRAVAVLFALDLLRIAIVFRVFERSSYAEMRASGWPPYSSSICCADCSADCSDAERPPTCPPVSFTIAVTSTATPFSSQRAYFA